MYKQYKLSQDLRVRRVCSRAPAFSTNSLNSGIKCVTKLEDYVGKYLIIIFYPSNFLEISSQELLNFNSYLSDFQDINCEILAISPDSIESHVAWFRAPVQSNGLDENVQFPLLEDKSLKICKAYGVSNDDNGSALMSVFIIDTNGLIRITICLDKGIHFSVKDILRMIKELQAKDKDDESELLKLSKDTNNN
ncbi:hypothetical protein MN116_000830 [Schistosoma mekongi]|uniref:thioredoxin-dependent peroxiredoxin n=1 Tax=Schistosoma mekongi TaxID=38744 RepID=A0AAE1ZK02_SCHME|nr:hypothetical protein MN116_000830 [Schistosoma mekongi]